jgi:hypothetical protein
MKNKTSALITIILILTILSCNESKNQISNQKTSLDHIDSTSLKLNVNLEDTFELPIKIDIEKEEYHIIRLGDVVVRL